MKICTSPYDYDGKGLDNGCPSVFSGEIRLEGHKSVILERYNCAG